MGKIGRNITEKEWPFQADWYSILYSATGIGFILERGEECAPAKAGDPRTIEVKPGYVISPTGTVRYFPGNTVQLDENPGNEPRLDLLVLKENIDDPGEMELVLRKGTPAERPKAPQLPHPDSEIQIPIAVVGFQKFSERVHGIFDTRSVLDRKHHHEDGEGLDLDRDNAEMNVKTDGETVVIEDGQLKLDESNIETEHLDIELEEGLEFSDDGIKLKKGSGLRFYTDFGSDESREVWFDAEEISGDGLKEDSDKLTVEAGDGVATDGLTADPDSTGITVDVGNGFLLDSGKLEADLVSDGGLDFDTDGQIYVDPKGFVSGAGLEVSDGHIDITPGIGLTIDTDLRTDVTAGLREWSEQLEVYTGDGTRIEDGKLRLDYDDLLSALAGNGLTTSDGKLEFGTSSGLTYYHGAVVVDPGEGMEADSGGLGLDTDEETLTIEDGALKVISSGIAGDGLGSDTEMYTLEMDSGEGGTVSPDEGYHEYEAGTEVQIYGDAYDDYQFSSWGGDIESYNNPEYITINSDMYVIGYFEPAGINSLSDDEDDDLTTASSGSDSLHVMTGEGLDASLGSLNIKAGFGVSVGSDEPISVNRHSIFGSSVSVYEDEDGVERGEVNFFEPAFEKVEYDNSVVIEAGGYTHMEVGKDLEGEDIWVFANPIHGQYDDHKNRLDVIFEQGAEDHDWWSIVSLENIGDQSGTEEGEIWIQYLGLTPKWKGPG